MDAEDMPPTVPSMRERTCREACRLLLEDPQVVIVLGEISLPYFKEGFERAPERIINAGIAEQTMIGLAAGFAMEGFHPIVHTIAPFLVERPFEQLKIDFGYQGLGGTFISTGASLDYAVEGSTHHSPADVSLVSTIPGFEVLVPGTAEEAESLLRHSYANGRPTYLRLSERQNPRSHDVRAGRIEIIRRGSSGVTIVAVGPMLGLVEEVIGGMDATLLYATTVTPFDSTVMAEEDSPHVIVVEPFLQGTMAAAVMLALQNRPIRLTCIGIPRTNLRGYGHREDLESVAGIDAVGLKRRIASAIASAGPPI